MSNTSHEDCPIPETGMDDPDTERFDPVHFHIDSVAPDKMQALLAAAQAQKALCEALSSCCTNVHIKNCTVVNSAGAGIQVSTGD